MTPRGNSWEKHEGLLMDWTNELMENIGAGEYLGADSFGRLTLEFADMVVNERDDPDFDAGEDLEEMTRNFLEVWAAWYLNTRRLQRVDHPWDNPHAGGDEEDYCAGNHEDGGCDV